MHELSDFKAGDRIRIHPACDLFMMGETHATVVSVGRKWIRIIGDRSTKKFTIRPGSVLEIIR